MAASKDFGFGEDEAIIRDTARKFLDQHSSVDVLRTLVAGDHHAAYEAETPPCSWDEAVWKQIVDLGWTALAVPEAAGGLDMKLVGVAALAEEIGRHAFPSPLLSTLVTTFALRAAGGDGAIGWLERIAAGAPATLAVTNGEGSWDPEATDVEARADGDGVILEGTASFVQDARKCSFFVVSASSDAGVGLYAVSADAPGVTIRPDRIVDLTRDQARVEFRGVRVEPTAIVAAPPEGAAALRRALPPILVVLSADITGAAEWQLQTTAEYAKIRKQFDHPIGFFQAVKHPIVNVMIAVDETRSLLYDAACTFDEEPERAEIAARMLKASASGTAAFASNRSIQLHGGIGVTWEASVHVYAKRQIHSGFLFGDAAYHRHAVGNLL